MKIAVIGANGKAGKLIVEEAVSRNLDVTAITRKENKSKALKSLQKDLFDLTTLDLTGYDVVIDAFGVWANDRLYEHTSSISHLNEILSGSNIRLIVVGGAGSLYVSKEYKTMLMDTPDFPDIYKPLAKNMADGLSKLRSCNNLLWTYISPAADFRPDGEKRGKYKLCGEEFTVNSNQESIISYADYAAAVIDEVLSETPHIKERISVIWD